MQKSGPSLSRPAPTTHFHSSARHGPEVAWRSLVSTTSIFRPARLGLAIGLSIGLSLSLGLSAEAAAQPFEVDISLSKKSQGTLEVLSAKDEVVLSRVELGRERVYSLDFPVEGLYILRIKQGDKVTWKETVFILTEQPKQDILMRASWAIRPGTMRTVIRVQDPAGALTYGVSIRDKIFLRLRATPRLVRVLQDDYSGGVQPAESVVLGKVTEAQATAEVTSLEPDIEINPREPEDDQAVYEPGYKGLLSGKEDKTWRQKVLDLSNNRRLVPLNRSHRASIWMRIMQESFRVRRSPDSYKGELSQGFGMGFGANLVFKDTMSLQLEVDTHGTKTEYEKGGANPPAAEQKRVHARFGPLFDVLNVEHKYPRFAFEIGPVVGYNQIPLEEDDQGLTDFGAALRWQYFGIARGEAVFRFMKSHSRDLTLAWIGAGYKIATLSPMFVLYNYHTDFSATEAKAEFDETGIRFGVSRDF